MNPAMKHENAAMNRAVNHVRSSTLAFTAAALTVCLAACGDTAADGPVDSSVTNADTKTGGKTGGAAGAAWVLTFDAQAKAAGPRIEIEPTRTGDKAFTVRLLLRDFNNLFGIAGHLHYDNKGLQLDDMKMHEVLDGGIYESRSIGKDSPIGRILLGATRFRAGGSPFGALAGAKVSKQVWSTLTFTVKKPGAWQIAFDLESTVAKTSTYTDIDTSFGKLTVELVEVK